MLGINILEESTASIFTVEECMKMEPQVSLKHWYVSTK
jgi:hypothetical protein